MGSPRVGSALRPRAGAAAAWSGGRHALPPFRPRARAPPPPPPPPTATTKRLSLQPLRAGRRRLNFWFDERIILAFSFKSGREGEGAGRGWGSGGPRGVG